MFVIDRSLNLCDSDDRSILTNEHNQTSSHIILATLQRLSQVNVGDQRFRLEVFWFNSFPELFLCQSAG